MGAAFIAHDVPMCHQQIGAAEWQQHGGAELGSAEEWSNRVCGMASLRMILLAQGQEAPRLTELVKAGIAIGAFSDRGLLHAFVAELAASLGVRGQAEAVPAEDLPGRLDGAPLIASVTTEFPVDGRRGGHLVVLRGYELGQADPLILFRDPSRWGQEHDRVRLSRLAQSYAGRGARERPGQVRDSRWSRAGFLGPGLQCQPAGPGWAQREPVRGTGVSLRPCAHGLICRGTTL